MSSTKAAEDVEILNSLGLGLSEAKVFSALSKLGASTAGTISKTSGVAREFVYRIMPNLMKKGLVEKIITSPEKFKAVPMKNAYTILLRRKEEENRKLWSKAMKDLKKRQKKSPPRPRRLLIPKSVWFLHINRQTQESARSTRTLKKA